MKEIVQEGAGVLREVAQPVREAAFGSPELEKLVADMAAALDQEPDGVALAAPQVGVSERVFIVRMDRVDIPPLPSNESHRNNRGDASMISGDIASVERPAEVEAYVNPEIVKTSRKRQKADEGCLSVRGVYGTTRRHERVTLRARRPDGTRFERGAGGLLAQIFEHEVDHLNGILFTDHAEDMVEVKPFEEKEELAHEHEHAA